MTAFQSPAASLAHFYAMEGRYSASGLQSDRDALLACLHPDIVLHQPGSLPYGGCWRGRAGFGRWLDAFTAAWTAITPLEPMLHACGDDMLVSTVTMRATARTTGAEVEMPMCQLIRFSGGLPIDWRNFAWDTAGLLAALGAPTAG